MTNRGDSVRYILHGLWVTTGSKYEEIKQYPKHNIHHGSSLYSSECDKSKEEKNVVFVWKLYLLISVPFISDTGLNQIFSLTQHCDTCFISILILWTSCLSTKRYGKVQTTDKLQQDQLTQDRGEKVQQFPGRLEFKYKRLIIQIDIMQTFSRNACFVGWRSTFVTSKSKGGLFWRVLFLSIFVIFWWATINFQISSTAKQVFYPCLADLLK